jgi:hypothetical protein
MSKKFVERTSIILDTIAFFVAAPDFLGEGILSAVRNAQAFAQYRHERRLESFATSPCDAVIFAH